MKWAPPHRPWFQMLLLLWQKLLFWLKFHISLFLRVQLTISGIGNGLVTGIKPLLEAIVMQSTYAFEWTARPQWVGYIRLSCPHCIKKTANISWKWNKSHLMKFQGHAFCWNWSLCKESTGPADSIKIGPVMWSFDVFLFVYLTPLGNVAVIFISNILNH